MLTACTKKKAKAIRFVQKIERSKDRIRIDTFVLMGGLESSNLKINL